MVVLSVRGVSTRLAVRAAAADGLEVVARTVVVMAVVMGNRA